VLTRKNQKNSRKNSKNPKILLSLVDDRHEDFVFSHFGRNQIGVSLFSGDEPVEKRPIRSMALDCR
jgi:hypothetical protein